MRAWVLSALLVAASYVAATDAAACASICYTTSLTGFGPGGTSGCTCTGSQQGARTGSGSCSCGQCYEETNGEVIGYAINSDGTCTYGTDCGDCDYSTSSSGSTTSSSTSKSSTTSSASSAGSSSKTTTTAPSTDAPSASSSGSSTASASKSATSDTGSNTGTTTSSTSSSGNAAGDAGSTAASSNSDSGGLKTWQIALIICCGVLIFTVAVVSVLSCYCKARNRLYENEDEQADATYYEQQYPRQRQDVVGSGAVATPTLFSNAPTSTRSHARSGSFTNELKPMYANSAHGSTDRLVGLAPVHMRNSSGDLAGMAGNYSMDRRPSGSNRSVGRRPSLEQGYTSRERDSLAVEL